MSHKLFQQLELVRPLRGARTCVCTCITLFHLDCYLQLPNFLLAAPVLSLVVAACLVYARGSAGGLAHCLTAGLGARAGVLLAVQRQCKSLDLAIAHAPQGDGGDGECKQGSRGLMGDATGCAEPVRVGTSKGRWGLRPVEQQQLIARGVQGQGGTAAGAQAGACLLGEGAQENLALMRPLGSMGWPPLGQGKSPACVCTGSALLGDTPPEVQAGFLSPHVVQFLFPMAFMAACAAVAMHVQVGRGAHGG